MREQKLVVYTGERQRGWILRKPRLITFEYNVPQAVDRRLLQYLPKGEFSDYKPDGKYQSGRPILVHLPNDPHELIQACMCVKELVAQYPTKPFELVLHKSDLHWLARSVVSSDTVSLSCMYRPEHGKYLREVSFKIPLDNPLASMKTKRTLESIYGEYTKTLTTNPMKPTLLGKSTGKRPACLIPPATMDDKWDSLMAALCEAMPEMRKIDSTASLEDQFKLCKDAAYVICVGNPTLTTALAYHGVRLFEFVDNNGGDIRLAQLGFFRNRMPNSVQYAIRPTTADPAFVAGKLKELLVDGVEVTEARERITLPDGSQEASRGSRYRPTNSPA
jgi:hypothetical protein